MNNFSLKAMPFDSEVITNPKTGQEEYDRVAHSKDLADLIRSYFSNGILVQGSDLLTNELQVLHLSAMSCVVKPGGIVINGRTGFVENEQTLEFDVGTQNPRIDRVVAELNIAERNIFIKVLKGVADVEPKPVAIMQTEDIYQIPLAQVRINASKSVIASVTDERAGYISNVLLNQAPRTDVLAKIIKVSELVKIGYGISVDNQNVDAVLYKALTRFAQINSYMAFCANANDDSIDAAFGKGNETLIYNLGKQLNMYANFKIPLSQKSYPNLSTLQNINEMLTKQSNGYPWVNEAFSDLSIPSVLCKTPYIRDKFKRLYPNTSLENYFSDGMVKIFLVHKLYFDAGSSVSITIPKCGFYKIIASHNSNNVTITSNRRGIISYEARNTTGSCSGGSATFAASAGEILTVVAEVLYEVALVSDFPSDYSSFSSDINSFISDTNTFVMAIPQIGYTSSIDTYLPVEGTAKFIIRSHGYNGKGAYGYFGVKLNDIQMYYECNSSQYNGVHTFSKGSKLTLYGGSNYSYSTSGYVFIVNNNKYLFDIEK